MEFKEYVMDFDSFLNESYTNEGCKTKKTKIGEDDEMTEIEKEISEVEEENAEELMEFYANNFIELSNSILETEDSLLFESENNLDTELEDEINEAFSYLDELNEADKEGFFAKIKNNLGGLKDKIAKATGGAKDKLKNVFYKTMKNYYMMLANAAAKKGNTAKASGYREKARNMEIKIKK
jgi:hypothetical protein